MILHTAASTLALFAAADAAPWRFHADHVLGTSLDMEVVADRPLIASLAEQTVLAEIGRLDRLLSGWRGDSGLAALNAVGGSLTVSPELHEVLAMAARLRTRTGGAFDERLGEVLRLWREAGGPAGREPDAAALQAALALARQPVRLVAAALQVTRPAGLSFALDGLAKGYIIDAAVAAARRAVPGLQGLMLDIGGDLRCWGRAPTEAGWRVGVSHPGQLREGGALLDVVRVADCAVATSGTGERDHSVGGRKLSHLLSPFSGLPSEGVASATVVAGTAAEADALATALAVMPPARGIALADGLPRVEASIVTASGERHVSAGWSGMVVPYTPSSGATLVQGRGGQTSPGWPSGFELEIQYEVPVIRGARYRKPYVAIWIGDERGRLVRTVLLLGGRPYWQDSNYVWWRRQGGDAAAMVEAISRPTRAPGRYTVTWDGRDDSGRPVGPGRYTVNVEAVRQFGGHDHASTPLSLGTEPTEGSIPAEGEIGATRLRYGRPR
ncbi:MAG: DUF2271 domain-containing protein [Azospirillum brasilense]|nr:MAG: DUF2271 domain-containing protein [Azospirillum brasilense]